MSFPAPLCRVLVLEGVQVLTAYLNGALFLKRVIDTSMFFTETINSIIQGADGPLVISG